MAAEIKENQMIINATGGPMSVDIAKIWNDEVCVHCGSELQAYGEFKYCFEGACNFIYIRHYTRSGNALFELCYNQK